MIIFDNCGFINHPEISMLKNHKNEMLHKKKVD